MKVGSSHERIQGVGPFPHEGELNGAMTLRPEAPLGGSGTNSRS
jgi:hypothetical protein